jgi:hypothetical protein
MSAFLDYSKTFRSEVIRNNPHVTDNKEISKILGALWRGASDAERHPFVEKELKARSVYKESIAQWRKQRSHEKKQDHSAATAKLPQEQPRLQKSSKVQVNSGRSTARSNNAAVSSTPVAPPAGNGGAPTYPPVVFGWNASSVNEPTPTPPTRDPNTNYYGYPAHLESGHPHGVEYSAYDPYAAPYSVNDNWSMDPSTAMYSPVNVNTVPPHDASYDYDRSQSHHPMPSLYQPQPPYYPQMHSSYSSGENMFSCDAPDTLNNQQYFHDAYTPHPQNRSR